MKKACPCLLVHAACWLVKKWPNVLRRRAGPHQVLNANQTAQEAFIVAQAGQQGQITVATNMAGRGDGINTLPEAWPTLAGCMLFRLNRTAAGASTGSYLVARHAKAIRVVRKCSAARKMIFLFAMPNMRGMGGALSGRGRLIKMAQANAERLARFNRKQVLKQDDWMDDRCLSKGAIGGIDSKLFPHK